MSESTTEVKKNHAGYWIAALVVIAITIMVVNYNSSKADSYEAVGFTAASETGKTFVSPEQKKVADAIGNIQIAIAEDPNFRDAVFKYQPIYAGEIKHTAKVLYEFVGKYAFIAQGDAENDDKQHKAQLILRDVDIIVESLKVPYAKSVSGKGTAVEPGNTKWAMYVNKVSAGYHDMLKFEKATSQKTNRGMEILSRTMGRAEENTSELFEVKEKRSYQYYQGAPWEMNKDVTITQGNYELNANGDVISAFYNPGGDAGTQCEPVFFNHKVVDGIMDTTQHFFDLKTPVYGPKYEIIKDGVNLIARPIAGSKKSDKRQIAGVQALMNQKFLKDNISQDVALKDLNGNMKAMKEVFVILWNKNENLYKLSLQGDILLAEALGITNGQVAEAKRAIIQTRSDLLTFKDLFNEKLAGKASQAALNAAYANLQVHYEKSGWFGKKLVQGGVEVPTYKRCR